MRYKPEYGEIYYIPMFEGCLDVGWKHWSSHSDDYWYLENGFVCKTEEEARSLGNKIIENIKEINND